MSYHFNFFIKLLIFMSISLHNVQLQLSGTNCDGKTFYCVDPEHFQVCIDLPGGRSETLEERAFPCPHGSYCDSTGSIECDSSTPPAETTIALTETSTTTTTTEISSTSTSSTTTQSPFFTCIKAGRFPDESDCHSYYSCLKLPLGLTKTHTECLFRMAFDGTSQRCTTDQSPCQTDFNCTSSGRYPDPLDQSSYYWCLKSRFGFEMFHMECGSGQIFDSNLGYCSVNLS